MRRLILFLCLFFQSIAFAQILELPCVRITSFPSQVDKIDSKIVLSSINEKDKRDVEVFSNGIIRVGGDRIICFNLGEFELIEHAICFSRGDSLFVIADIFDGDKNHGNACSVSLSDLMVRKLPAIKRPIEKMYQIDNNKYVAVTLDTVDFYPLDLLGSEKEIITQKDNYHAIVSIEERNNVLKITFDSSPRNNRYRNVLIDLDSEKVLMDIVTYW